MKTRFFKNIKHIMGDFIYYLFYPISKLAVSRYKRKNKKMKVNGIIIDKNTDQELFLEQLKKLEYYKLFKDRENSSYFNENDNME